MRTFSRSLRPACVLVRPRFPPPPRRMDDECAIAQAVHLIARCPVAGRAARRALCKPLPRGTTLLRARVAWLMTACKSGGGTW